MKQTLTAKLKKNTSARNAGQTKKRYKGLDSPPKFVSPALTYRPKKGLLFCCVNCHSTLHADLIGARNIVMRTLLVRQDWARTGQLSVAPGSCSQESDVSVIEAKAARLRRYAELRWRPDTSPRLSSEGI